MQNVNKQQKFTVFFFPFLLFPPFSFGDVRLNFLSTDPPTCVPWNSFDCCFLLLDLSNWVSLLACFTSLSIHLYFVVKQFFLSECRVHERYEKNRSKKSLKNLWLNVTAVYLHVILFTKHYQDTTTETYLELSQTSTCFTELFVTLTACTF